VTELAAFQGKCPACGNIYLVTRSGKIDRHPAPGGRPELALENGRCWGSDNYPVLDIQPEPETT
jgi:hypothetical protein